MPSNAPRNSPQHSAHRRLDGTRSKKNHPKRTTRASIALGLRHSADVWRTMVAAGEMSPQTFLEYTGVGERFIPFAAAHGIKRLNDVTPELALAFVNAPGRDRQGQLFPVPADATSRQRASGLTALFRACRAADLTTAHPLADAPKIPRTPRRTGTPLYHSDIHELRLHAEAGHPATREAALLALALAGFTSAEVASATTADLDRDLARVFTAGTTYTDARHCPLDPWALRVLSERADHLVRASRLLGPEYLVTSATSAYRRQCSVGAGFITIARRAGLRTERRSIVYRDVTRYVARRVFKQTGELSAVAERLGIRSLEVAAAYAGYTLATVEEE